MDKVWLQHYPKDVPHEINPDEYSSLVDMFEKAVARNPDVPAYINMGKALTSRKLEQRSRHLASYLQNKCQLKKGDRIAIMMPNLLQYPITLFAALRAGLVVVNVNPLYTPRELEHQLKDSGVKAIVVASNFASNLEKIIANTEIEHVILTRLGDQLSFGKKTLVNFVIKYIKKLVPKYKLPGAVSFREALSEGKKYQYIKPCINNDDIAFLQYTGGTTGVAKGAILTHRNISACVIQTRDWISPSLKDTENAIAISPLPLYHIFALSLNAVLMLELGLRNVLITNPKDINGLIKEFKRYPFAVITGVNTLYNALIHDENFKTVDFSNLRITVAGGMSVQTDVAVNWQAITGVPILEGYGMTECSPLISACPHNITEHNASIGFPIPSTNIKILDDDQNPVGLNEVGELWVNGPQVMQGYWNNQAETEKVLQDGWVATGDIVKINEDGLLRIVDRKKDVIIVSGFNVYPTEIEDVIALNPKILEVVVVGVPNYDTGELVKVFAVKKDPSLTREELRQYCRKYLTGYKIPRQIEFRDELPKAMTGKILRRVLRDEEIDKLAQVN